MRAQKKQKQYNIKQRMKNKNTTPQGAEVRALGMSKAVNRTELPPTHCRAIAHDD